MSEEQLAVKAVYPEIHQLRAVSAKVGGVMSCGMHCTAGWVASSGEKGRGVLAPGQTLAAGSVRHGGMLGRDTLCW